MTDSIAASPSPLVARLLKSRNELLDLTLRNPLLNYRPSLRRGVEIVDENAAQIFEWLVVEGKPLRFHATRKSKPKPKAGEGQDVVEFVPIDGPEAGEEGVGGANPENSLATPCTREELQARLGQTAYEARLTLQEQGANTLFLALGILRWRESEASTEDRFAPVILVPVNLERKNVRAQWQIAPGDEEPGANLSLAEKFRNDFGIRLPASPDLETAAGFSAYLDEVAKAAEGRTGWDLNRNRAALGFFSFGKFLMYRDLDPEAWPSLGEADEHRTVRSLLEEGFREPPSPVDPAKSLDAHRPPGQVMEIMDCDGSQAEALADVSAGRNLVIQGPPGTGKSQTISNLISEAVAAGRKVLFVAEKMAALDVVKRRLEQVGLGPLCLELHSHKVSKKDVAADLAATLALGRPMAAPEEAVAAALPESRERLNLYSIAASTPVDGSETPPFEAIGTLFDILAAHAGLPKLPGAGLESRSRREFTALVNLVKELAGKVGELGVPAKHPFNGCERTDVLPSDLHTIRASLRAVTVALSQLLETLAALANVMTGRAATTSAEVERHLGIVALALEAPELRGLPPVGAAWNDSAALGDLAVAMERGRAWLALHAANDARLRPEAWTTDVAALRLELEQYRGKWWRLLSGRYRAAKARMLALCAAPPASQADLIGLAEAVIAAQQQLAEIASRAARAAPLLGPLWLAERSDWDRIAAISSWVQRFRAFVAAGADAAAFEGWVVGAWDGKSLKREADRVRASLGTWMRTVAELTRLLAMSPSPAALPFEDLARRLDTWSKRVHELPSYVAYWRVREQVKSKGLADFVDLVHDGALAAPQMTPALRKTRAEAILDAAFRDRPELRDFDAVTHEQAVLRFRQADAAAFAVSRAKLARQHWQSLPPEVGYGQVGLVRRECAKRARHIPLRQLLDQAVTAVQSIKPVFLMSPLSVAKFLPRRTLFDLVVFDEASQVKPVDALGAIFRGEKLVVVGDEKQLPPTSFFDTLFSGDAAPENDEAPPDAGETRDMQSILGLCTARGMPSRMLRWHYRSRHDSLIALSNQEFYGNQLVIFPSAQRTLDGEGLAFRHLPETVYERGTTRSNPLEADAVAAAVLEHFRTRPQLSIGVVAFSQAQRKAIEARIEAGVRKHPEYDALISESREEPFFVKNLENVQGDERDVIFISVGYGKDKGGVATMNFGPLNQAGGERRLNVLITRARRNCVVFANLSGDDIDVARAPGAGVRALKAFLDFARSGRLDGPKPTGREADSEFEVQVREALTSLGYDVEPQVGSAGYRVDLAVVDPERRGRYLLGIECDGATYHGARWARDRDRLRQSVLESLGWTLHRVWSTDWFRDREGAIQRIRAAIEAAKAGGVAAAARVKSEFKREAGAPSRGPQPAAPYVETPVKANLGDRHLAEVDALRLGKFIAGIVEKEQPVHVEEIRRRVLDAIDGRASGKRVEAIDEAVAEAVAAKLLRREGDFLSTFGDGAVTVRDRSALSDASRALDHVADEECRLALQTVIQDARGCTPEEASVQAVKLLGAKRNDEGLKRLQALLQSMVDEGRLRREGVHVVIQP